MLRGAAAARTGCCVRCCWMVPPQCTAFFGCCRRRRSARAPRRPRKSGVAPPWQLASPPCGQRAANTQRGRPTRWHRGAMPTAARDVASQARQGAAAALVHRGFCAQHHRATASAPRPSPSASPHPPSPRPDTRTRGAPTPLRMQPAPLASAHRTRGGRGGSTSHRRATGCLCRTAACRPWPARHGDGWMPSGARARGRLLPRRRRRRPRGAAAPAVAALMAVQCTVVCGAARGR